MKAENGSETYCTKACDTCFPSQHVDTPAPAPKLITVARTQKAKGIRIIRDTYGGLCPEYKLVQRTDDPLIDSVVYPAFARPCPVLARHGFVDSRVVKSADEARGVMSEALQADHLAEMLLMRPIDAMASAVITPQSATLGPGNDGATSGKQCIVIPLINVDTGLDNAAAGITEAPYAEAVYDDCGRSYLVQLRNGPAVSAANGNWIPSNMTVRSVLIADHSTESNATPADLLAWEKLLASAPQGTALYHPGGALTSHYSVHAILNKIPVLINGPAPRVGDKLKANVDKIAKHDIGALRKGVNSGLAASLRGKDHAEQINLVLLACHHSTALTTAHGSWLLGYAAMLMVRYGLVAAYGEGRHGRRWKRTRYKHKPSRGTIYQDVFDTPLKCLKGATKLYQLFLHGRWPGGYGGKPWANCTEETLQLDWALRRAYKEGTQKAINGLIKQFHTAINCAHNNGWWLNKFSAKSAFDAHAKGMLLQILKTLRVLWIAVNEAKDRKDDSEETTQRTAKAWASKRKARIYEGTADRTQLDARRETKALQAKAKASADKAIAKRKAVLTFRMVASPPPLWHFQYGQPGKYQIANFNPKPAEHEALVNLAVALRDAGAEHDSLSGSATTYAYLCKATLAPSWIKTALKAHNIRI